METQDASRVASGGLLAETCQTCRTRRTSRPRKEKGHQFAVEISLAGLHPDPAPWRYGLWRSLVLLPGRVGSFKRRASVADSPWPLAAFTSGGSTTKGRVATLTFFFAASASGDFDRRFSPLMRSSLSAPPPRAARALTSSRLGVRLLPRASPLPPYKNKRKRHNVLE